MLALLAGTAMIATAGAANATAFSVSASATTTTPPNVTKTDAKSFAQFDPATGTLTGVKFTLTSTSDVDSIASITGGEGGTAKSSMSATFDILGPGAGGPLAVTLFSGTGDATAHCDEPGHVSCTSSTTDTKTLPTFASTITVTNAGDLASYEGLGTFTLTPTIVLQNLSAGCLASTTNGPPNCKAPQASASWSGDISVEFLVEPKTTPPTGVPEPATLGLLGLGLLGAGLIGRRARKSS